MANLQSQKLNSSHFPGLKRLNKALTWRLGLSPYKMSKQNQFRLWNSTDQSVCSMKFYLKKSPGQNFSKQLLASRHFFNCYLAASWPILDHYRWDNPTNPFFYHCVFFNISDQKVNEELRNEVESLSQAKRLMEFELRNFGFWLQCLNPLGHSPCTS